MDCDDEKCSHVAREGEWSTGFREPNIKPGGGGGERGIRIRRRM